LIAILDYGSGNLRSAERAFATSGKDVVVTSDRAVALEAEGLVVPGVGAFAACMNGLNAVDGAAIVRERLAKERPTLGICIGMQILFSQGTEHSESAAHAGVGIWDGVISKLDAPILPHMGLKPSLFTLFILMPRNTQSERCRHGAHTVRSFWLPLKMATSAQRNFTQKNLVQQALH
jgi:imidazole glycerol phosphate synthase glutamine amidotransferase subunit